MPSSFPSGVRLAALTALTAAAVGVPAVAGQAAAATATVSRVAGVVTYVGTAAADDVRVERDFLRPGQPVVAVTGSAQLTPGPGCHRPAGAPVTLVHCGYTASRVDARLGAGSDSFRSTIPLSGTVDGGTGADTFHAGVAAGPSAIAYTGGDGFDTVDYTGATSGIVADLGAPAPDGRPENADKDSLTTVERVLGSRHNDTLTGDDKANLLVGGTGADRLSGGGGHDILDARDGMHDKRIDCGADVGDLARTDESTDEQKDDPTPIGCESVTR
ncbi:hypothetical protein ABGB17_11280 [Sphaerisporangium sp. B11E5]|uniref:calcium-binding protein n=1 Tax=Sphaerisporangium sp. B11E5 TaxID=3153563 RepID=UPI00325F87EA